MMPRRVACSDLISEKPGKRTSVTIGSVLYLSRIYRQLKIIRFSKSVACKINLILINYYRRLGDNQLIFRSDDDNPHRAYIHIIFYNASTRTYTRFIVGIVFYVSPNGDLILRSHIDLNLVYKL